MPTTRSRRSRPARPDELGTSELRYADGVRRAEPLTPDQQVALYARCLHEGQSELVEVAAVAVFHGCSTTLRTRSCQSHKTPGNDESPPSDSNR